jgi:hypothetical protein
LLKQAKRETRRLHLVPQESRQQAGRETSFCDGGTPRHRRGRARPFRPSELVVFDRFDFVR